MTSASWRVASAPDWPGPPSGESEQRRPAAPGEDPFVAGDIPTSISGDEIPEVRPDLVETVLDGHTIVLPTSRPIPHVLNASASMIWQLFDGQRTVDEITGLLAHRTGLDEIAISGDVHATIARLLHAELISIGEMSSNHSSDGAISADGPRWPRHIERLLDNTDWSRSIGPFSVGATTLMVRTNSLELGSELSRLLALLPSSDDPTVTTLSLIDRGKGPRRVVLYKDGQRRWWQPSVAGAPDRLVSELNLIVASGSAGHVVLHAGAVERGGRVAVIVGHSGQGKSTLVAALARRGLAYLTDEAVAIDVEDLHVRTYLKPLALDSSSLALLGLDTATTRAEPRKVLVTPDRLGSPSDGGRVAVVVVLTSDPNEVSAEDLDPSSPIDTLFDLLQSTFPASLEEPRSLDALATLVDEASILRLPRLPLDEACERIETALLRGPALTGGTGPSRTLSSHPE